MFSYPKPVSLISYLISLLYDETKKIHPKDFTILDFFSGSGTTAQACMELNSEDNGHRKFILVQLPEKLTAQTEAYKSGYSTICDIAKERIRISGDTILGADTGFKVFKLDTSNIKKWEGAATRIEESLQTSIFNYVSDRTEMDIVYEIMLKCGLEITTPVEEQDGIYIIRKGSMLICMQDEISQSIGDKIVEIKESQGISEPIVVFKDNGFPSDSVKTNIKETLRVSGIKEFITI